MEVRRSFGGGVRGKGRRGGMGGLVKWRNL
jgi:hypothetical protein